MPEPVAHVHPFMPPLVDEDEKILVVDNFQLSMFQTCNNKYLKRIVEGWQPNKPSTALTAGQVMHTGLEVWYLTHDVEAAKNAIEESWPQVEFIDDDFRDMTKVMKVMDEYVRRYPSELWNVVGVDTEQPMLEVSFTLPLLDENGKQCVTYDGYKILYGGIFDVLLNFNKQLYVMDHKTTSRMGKYYFTQYKPNNQITGYIWGAQQLTSQRVGGAFINAIGWYKKSPTVFERHLTMRNADELAAWTKDVRFTCDLIRIAMNTGQWPKFTSACTLYGKCEFHDVHVLSSEKEQERYLEQFFKKEHWDHESRGSAHVIKKLKMLAEEGD